MPRTSDDVDSFDEDLETQKDTFNIFLSLSLAAAGSGARPHELSEQRFIHSSFVVVVGSQNLTLLRNVIKKIEANKGLTKKELDAIHLHFFVSADERKLCPVRHLGKGRPLVPHNSENYRVALDPDITRQLIRYATGGDLATKRNSGKADRQVYLFEIPSVSKFGRDIHLERKIDLIRLISEHHSTLKAPDVSIESLPQALRVELDAIAMRHAFQERDAAAAAAESKPRRGVQAWQQQALPVVVGAGDANRGSLFAALGKGLASIGGAVKRVFQGRPPPAQPAMPKTVGRVTSRSASFATAMKALGSMPALRSGGEDQKEAGVPLLADSDDERAGERARTRKRKSSKMLLSNEPVAVAAAAAAAAAVAEGDSDSDASNSPAEDRRPPKKRRKSGLGSAAGPEAAGKARPSKQASSGKAIAAAPSLRKRKSAQMLAPGEPVAVAAAAAAAAVAEGDSDSDSDASNSLAEDQFSPKKRRKSGPGSAAEQKAGGRERFTEQDPEKREAVAAHLARRRASARRSFSPRPLLSPGAMHRRVTHLTRLPSSPTEETTPSSGGRGPTRS